MTGLTEQQLARIRDLATQATNRPFLYSDCEGVLKVWALSALTHVTRDETGTVTGWSEPGSYTAADLVAEVELDMGTWDPGEDMDDDQRRRDVGDLVAAREALPVLLAEVERLRASATGAHRRIEEVLDYLATKDAGAMGFHIVAVLDGAQTAAERAEQLAEQGVRLADLTAARARVAALEQQLAAAQAERADRHDDLAGALGYANEDWADLISIAAANTATVSGRDARPAPYRSSPLPPRDAICAGADCGHSGAEHHHGDTKCWAHLPRVREANGTWSGTRICPCKAFVPAGGAS